MSVAARRDVRSFVLAAFVLLSYACGEKPPGTNDGDAGADCKVHRDCPVNHACQDGACVAVAAPKIVTESLPDAYVGEAWTAQVAHEGGVPPFTWLVKQRAPALQWIAIDASTGELSGTPSGTTVNAAALTVAMTDALGREAERAFVLDVLPCKEGQSSVCFGALPTGGCGKGTATCTGGVLGECMGLQPSTDTGHCGASCGACDTTTASVCASGLCACGQGSECGPGATCCGTGTSATCVATDSDPSNCGACGNVCTAPANADAVCNQGTCSYVCKAGFETCDPLQPCGTNVLTSTENCGACGAACTGGGFDACQDGACVCGAGPECSSGDTCCPANGTLSTRCADLQNGAAHGIKVVDCGSCGAECNPPQGPGPGEAFCAGGACGARCLIDSSGNQWADCAADAGTAKACTVNLTTGDVNNCGSCGNKCGTDPNATATCSQGACGLNCNPGFGKCSVPTKCDDLSATATCGANCQACNQLPNPTQYNALKSGCCKQFDAKDNSCDLDCIPGSAASACTCRYTCAAGFADCDLDVTGKVTNGCEVNLAQGAPQTTGAVNHCGACGTTCSKYSNTTPGCSNGICSWACTPGFGNCDGNIANGCENTLNSLQHCGGCNLACPTPTMAQVASVSCSTGMCRVVSCKPGYGNCDGNHANGCETNLMTSKSHCGTCGNACTQGLGWGCYSGICECPTCP